MNIFLVSNNLVIDNISYESFDSILDKRINRVLSIEGEKLAVKIVKKLEGDIIYSSSYASSLGTAKYYASYKNTDIYVNSFLNDALVGDMGSRNIKMLRFMQERDFDFKFKNGESLNDVSRRMNIAISNIIKKHGKKDIVIFTHKRAIMGYLLPYLDKGFNLDDRLILSFNDTVILDDTNTDIDIIKVSLDHGKVVNVKVIEGSV